MAEAARFARRGIEFAHLAPNRPHHALDHHLRDALTAFDHDRLGAEVDRDDLDFTAVVRVDGAGAIEQRQSMLQGQPAPRPDLRLEAGRQRERNPGGNQYPLVRRDLDRSIEIGVEIHAGRSRRHIRRQTERRRRRPHAFDFDAQFFHEMVSRRSLMSACAMAHPRLLI